MPISVIMPRVDMDMETGRIARWLVASGAAVKQGDALFEIETDKATMEIEAPASGTLCILIDASDAAIRVATMVGEIHAPGEIAPFAPAVSPAPAPTPVAATPAPAPILSVIRTGSPLPAAALPRATPLARRQAALRGIDLAAIPGSGPRGRVTSRDVAQATLPERHPRPQAPTPATIVYLHGFAGSPASWAALRTQTQPDLPHLAIDLPWHGQAAPAASATITGMAAAILATIRATTPGPLHLVGHSLGGALAARLAISGLLDIRSLLLIAPVGLGPEIDHDFIAGLLRARNEASLRPWLYRLVHNPALVTRGMVQSVLTLLADPARAEGLAALAANAFPDGTQSAEWQFDAATLKMPARIVFGRADHIIPSRQAHRIDGAVAVNLLHDIGHMPHIEAVDTLASIHHELIRSAGTTTGHHASHPKPEGMSRHG